MPGTGTIAEMTRADLARFVLAAIQQSPATLPGSLDLEDLSLTGGIKLSDKAIQDLKTYLGL